MARLLFAASVLFLVSCGSAASSPGPLNISKSQSATVSRQALATFNGSQVIAFAETNADNLRQIHVKQQGTSGWAELGGSLNVDPAHDTIEPSIAARGSTLVVAWPEFDDTGRPALFVRSWNGSAWAALGGVVSAGNVVGRVSLAIGSTGTPFVAWSQGEGAVSKVHVARWDGVEWQPLGEALNVGTRSASEPSLALDASDRPVVAWGETSASGLDTDVYVKAWDGAAWVARGGALDVDATRTADLPSIAVDADGTAWVAWEENSAGGFRVHAASGSGATWTALPSLPDILSTRPALARGASGPTFIVWDTAEGVSLSSIDGSTVTPWNDSQFAGSDAPALLIDGTQPVVALVKDGLLNVVRPSK